MPSILIDGYNLIGIQHRDIEAARARLVEELIKYSRARQHSVTVVFDGWRDGWAEEHRELHGGVIVIYSPIGQRADEVINRLVSESATSEPLIVITTDREVQSHAWGSGAVAIDSEVFERKMHAASRDGLHADKDDEEDEEYFSSPRKGNPHKISKRQRMYQRALSKL